MAINAIDYVIPPGIVLGCDMIKTVLIRPNQTAKVTVMRPSPQSALIIEIQQLDDGTVNIKMPNGGITKIWPEALSSSQGDYQSRIR